MDERFNNYVHVILLAILMGFLVGLSTFAFIGETAFNLPGGSIASGFSIGMFYALKVLKPHKYNYIYLIAGGASGLIGFLIFLALFV